MRRNSELVRSNSVLSNLKTLSFACQSQEMMPVRGGRDFFSKSGRGVGDLTSDSVGYQMFQVRNFHILDLERHRDRSAAPENLLVEPVDEFIPGELREAIDGNTSRIVL